MQLRKSGAVLPPLPHLLGTAAVRRAAQRVGGERLVGCELALRDPSAQAGFFLFFPLFSPFFFFPLSLFLPSLSLLPSLHSGGLCGYFESCFEFSPQTFCFPFSLPLQSYQGQPSSGSRLFPVHSFYLKSGSIDASRCSFHHWWIPSCLGCGFCFGWLTGKLKGWQIPTLIFLSLASARFAAVSALVLMWKQGPRQTAGNKGGNMRLFVFLIKGEESRKRNVFFSKPRKAGFKRSPSRLRREEIL